MKAKDYKPQIDGLRALAVLPVIFFHAGFNFFEGGFVGLKFERSPEVVGKPIFIPSS